MQRFWTEVICKVGVDRGELSIEESGSSDHGQGQRDGKRDGI